MKLLKLTPENVKSYLNKQILFRTRGVLVKKTILGHSESCDSIHIEHPDLNNSLEIKGRCVYVILE